MVIVGASADPTKRGNRAVRALRDSGFRGRIVPVHPGGGELFGLPVARGASDLAEPPDLVLVSTPAATVPAVLEEWGSAGARAAVVLAAGFAESGDSGSALERAVHDVAARTGMRVVGPNTSGILNLPIGLNLIGVDAVAPGSLSLLVQSGNIALALITEAARAGLGFSCVIGLGNEADVAFHECLDFLAADKYTGAIVIHAEGFRDGGAFLAAARRAAGKPIVMIKGGRTTPGSSAARSHTGAISGSYAALRAGLAQAGVIEARRTDELLPVISTLVGQRPVLARGGIVILSDGGGQSTIAVDNLAERSVPLASLGPRTQRRLRELLGPAAAVTNPVDLAGAADRDPLVFARALELIAFDQGIAGVLIVGLFGGYAIRFAPSLIDAEVEAARRLPEIARRAGIALIVHTVYAMSESEPLHALREAGILALGSLEVACRCASAVVERQAVVERLRSTPNEWPPGCGSLQGTGSDRGVFDEARREGRSALLETEARELVASFGLSLVPARLCRTSDEAAAAASSIDHVAVRAVSPSVPHKTEAGAVTLNVAHADVARATERVFEAVRTWCARRARNADIRGALISPMLARPVAELLVGIVRDPDFGPVITVGAGGTTVELQRDVATRVLPISPAEVHEMLRELRIAPLFAGYRGAPGADTGAIEHAVTALARCALACPEIAEIEVNPLFVYEDRAVAIDVRVFLA